MGTLGLWGILRHACLGTTWEQDFQISDLYINVSGDASHSSWDFPDHVLRPCTPFKEGTLRPVQFHRGTRNRSSRSAARAVVAVVFGVMVVLRVVVVGPCVLTS